MTSRFVLDEFQRGERVDKVLSRLMPDTSRAAIQRWIREGRVHADGVVCAQRLKTAPGMVLDVDPGAEPCTTVQPDASVPFGVLFEDEFLIVVDKPAGIVVHPARGHWTGTLVSGLLARPGFEAPPVDDRDPEGQLRPGIVHRIDKDTSGVLVVAKHVKAREGLKSQLAAHSMGRSYQALTLGVPLSGCIDSLHGRHPRSRLKFSSRVKEGKRATTHIRVMETFSGAAALMECKLETGRTHQIRVHLSENAQTPLIADALYGRLPTEPWLALVSAAIGRQALHARTLRFDHPITSEKLSFDAELPADFLRALQLLRSGPAEHLPSSIEPPA